MPEPSFDRSTGWWSIRIRTTYGTRLKISLTKDPRWKKDGSWPPAGRSPRPPAEILRLARPYQDRDTTARLGIQVAIPRATDMGRFLSAYAASYAVSRRPGSIALLNRAIASWRVWCDSVGIQTIERVSRADCRSYLEDRTRAGFAFNTVRSERGCLRAAFTRAVEDGLIASNPWSGCQVPGKDRSQGTPSYTADEVTKIAAVLVGWQRDMWLVGVHCGFRSMALRGLRWRDVQWTVPRRQYGLLECRAELAKGGRPYTVPLSDPLRSILARRYAATRPGKNDLIFPGRAADGGMSRTTFARALLTACRRSGVPYRGHPWHSMRATFATICHARGVNPRTIQAWMNHSSMLQTDRYSHYSTEQDDSEAAKLS